MGERMSWARVGFARVVDHEYWAIGTDAERAALRRYRDDGDDGDDLELTVDGEVVAGDDVPTACDGIDWTGSDEALGAVGT
jgi:hypothetical protein